MINQPLVIGSTYRLKFKSTFERHGVCVTPGVTCLHQGGGVFRLEQITNFRDLVLSGIKLYDVFFKPLGIPEEEYQKYFDGKPADEYTPEYKTQTVNNETVEQVSKTEGGKLVLVDRHVTTQREIHVETGRSILKRHFYDSVDYASYPIYKFADVIDTNDVIYVPELTLDSFPEIDIREYRDLSLVVHLGYLNDPTSLDPMLLSIRERMAAYGWRPKNVKLYTTDTKWMSPAEYDAIKELRIPATIETITADNKEEMLGQFAIVSGSLKKIVDEVVDSETEIDINAIMKHAKTLDNRLFMTRCEDGDVFVTGDNYYAQVSRTSGDEEVHCKQLLKEGRDYAPGNPCVTYELATSESREPYYKHEPTTYSQVPYGQHGNYPAERLLMKFGTKNYDKVDHDQDRDFGITYYLKDDEEYIPATERDFEQQFKSSLTYYEKDGDTYVVTGDTRANPTKEYYIKNDDETYRRALVSDFMWFKEGVDYYICQLDDVSYRAATEEEIADMTQVLYIRNPEKYTKVEHYEEGVYVRVFKSIDEKLYTDIWKENYASQQALSLMGFKFDFDDNFGQAKSVILQLEDIIDLASKETNVVLPHKSYDYETFWKKYDGRKFRWVEPSTDPNDPTLTTTVEVKISEKTVQLLSEKPGVLLGQSGQVFKETYVKDSNQQKRNYYMLYVKQSKTVDEQTERIAVLERALRELHARHEELKTENESLQHRIEELTTT